MEEIRRGNVVIHREEEAKMTMMGDLDNIREFKLEVIGRLEKLEKEMELLRKGQVKTK